MDKDVDGRTSREKTVASKQVMRAAKEWRAAKKRERETRDALARLVLDSVQRGLLTENKIANMTDIPRMTIRKMLGKDKGR